MFNLIGIGEKAGSGFDVMREGCLFAGTAAPELEVFDDPGRVQLTLYPRKIAGDSMIAGASAVPGVSADGGALLVRSRRQCGIRSMALVRSIGLALAGLTV